jgi:HemY protein
MKLIIYFALLISAAWAGVLLRQDPGVMMLSFGDLLIEMPMWLAVVFILAIIVVILFCSRMINELFSGYYNSKNYFKSSKKRQAKQRTTQALLQLAQSQWEGAEKNAIKGAAFSDLPFLNYVSAAKAAQEQQAWERRDKY